MRSSLVFGCLLLMFGIARTEASVSISALVDGFRADGFQVTVTCTLTGNPSPSAVQQVALAMSRTRGPGSKPPSPVAAINVFDQGQVTKNDSFQGTAEGTFDPKTQTASLQVKFKNIPVAEMSGEFSCETTGLNRFGRCVRESENKSLTLDDLDLGNLVKDYTRRKGKRDLETQVCQSSLERLRKKYVAVLKSQSEDFWVTGLFNGSSFYVLTGDDQNCLSEDKLGGHLAEINSEAEFDFLETEIFSDGYGFPNGDKYILTGAKFSTLDGPFQFVKHPEDPIFLDRWDEDEPDRYNLKYSWLLLRNVDGKRMLMHDGLYENHDVNYLCEITI